MENYTVVGSRHTSALMYSGKTAMVERIGGNICEVVSQLTLMWINLLSNKAGMYKNKKGKKSWKTVKAP